MFRSRRPAQLVLALIASVGILFNFAMWQPIAAAHSPATHTLSEISVPPGPR